MWRCYDSGTLGCGGFQCTQHTCYDLLRETCSTPHIPLIVLSACTLCPNIVSYCWFSVRVKPKLGLRPPPQGEWRWKCPCLSCTVFASLSSLIQTILPNKGVFCWIPHAVAPWQVVEISSKHPCLASAEVGGWNKFVKADGWKKTSPSQRTCFYSCPVSVPEHSSVSGVRTWRFT